METTTKPAITIEANINAAIEKVWQKWNSEAAITQWNTASPDWHTPTATHDHKPGGVFSYRMEAKDGSFGFDFAGVFDIVTPEEYIESTLGDGRKVRTSFSSTADGTHISQTFEAEAENTLELQREGWQAILNNFKAFVESLNDVVKFHFEVTINAPVQQVYNTMLGEGTYTEWTHAFHPGSFFRGSWEKGSKILFIGPDENGGEGGMVSCIAENIPGKFVSIKHLGLLKGDEEITSGPEVEGWGNAYENYTFEAVDEGTLLSVDVDGIKEYQEFFVNTWPIALNKLKEISEK